MWGIESDAGRTRIHKCLRAEREPSLVERERLAMRKPTRRGWLSVPGSMKMRYLRRANPVQVCAFDEYDRPPEVVFAALGF